MKKLSLFALCALAAQAHFMWILPDPAGAFASVVLNEELKPGQVGVKMLAGAKLTLRGADGKDIPLGLSPDTDSTLTAKLPGEGNRMVYGTADLGLNERGAKPNLLLYYSKTYIGDPFDAHFTPAGAPVELFPVKAAGGVKFRLIARGKPLPNAEVTVLVPNGKDQKVKTNDSGETEVFPQSGRFGAWARFWEPEAGERDGKKYEETRHYAMLVFDMPFASLPQATSSFGAVASNGWLYVYGGHTKPTHSYSVDSVSGRFDRLKLADHSEWQQLPGGPGLQGMNLAAWNGKILRVGGMAPLNQPGAKADNHSTAECAAFDPAANKWQPLPPLPEARSSHDVVVIGNTVYVMGGWNLRGDQPSEWFDTLLTLDLSAKEPVWKASPQPFHRRALIAAAHNGKVYVLGGLDEKNKVTHEVAIYDPETAMWSTGPELPGNTLDGFAPAAVEHEGRLYVSLGDGSLYRLNETTHNWEKSAQASPRVAHRLVSDGKEILIVGGASRNTMLNLIEAVQPPAAR